MSRESKTSPRRLKAAQRQLKALELRRAGETFEAIAEQLDYSGRGVAYRAVMAALRKTLQEPADEVRKLELERLDELLRSLWPKAQDGNQGAVDRILRIMQRRALLLGLDAPQAVDVTSGGESIGIREVIVELPREDSSDGDAD